MSASIGPNQLDLAEQIARIRKAQAESDKLAEETRKYISEAHKLDAEAAKLNRERWWQPALAITGLIGGIVSVVTLVLHAIGRI